MGNVTFGEEWLVSDRVEKEKGAMADITPEIYARNVRDFMSSLQPPTKGIIRGGKGIAAAPPMPAERADALADKALELQMQGDALSKEWEKGLVSPDKVKRLAAERRLLAQMALETTLASAMLGAQGGEIAGVAGMSRGFRRGPEIPEFILIWLQSPLAPISTVRGAPRPSPNLETAKARLEHEVESAIALILSSTNETGQKIIRDLMVQDFSAVLEGLSLLGIGLADKLGKAATKLVVRALQFLSRAYRRLRALLGTQGVASVKAQISTWEDALDHGTLFRDLIARVYGLDSFAKEREVWLNTAAVPPEELDKATQAIIALSEAYPRSMEAVDQVLKGLAFVKMVPLFGTPTGRVAIAGMYAGLTGYVTYTGYDYIGSQGKLFDRVDGIRDILIQALKVPVGATHPL